MTDERKQEEEITVRADSSASATLAAMAAVAPPPVAEFIEHQAAIVLHTELPKLRSIVEFGPVLDMTDQRSLTEVYTGAMDRMTEAGVLMDGVTATVRDCALELAEVIDRSVKRIRLEDTKVNRMAYMTLSSTHARLTKTLADLMLTAEQLAAIEDAEDARA